jgi:hypothetical protein
MSQPRSPVALAACVLAAACAGAGGPKPANSPAPAVNPEPRAVDPEAGRASRMAKRIDALSPFRPEPLPVASDLTGIWYEVPGDTPPGPFKRPTPCFEGLGWVSLVQEGDAVMLRRTFPEPASGALRVETIDTTERASGRRDGDDLQLDGETEVVTTSRSLPRPPRREVTGHARWHLVYDRASGHLVGTHDRAPMRLAPLILVPRVDPGGAPRPDPCGSPPP